MLRCSLLTALLVFPGSAQAAVDVDMWVIRVAAVNLQGLGEDGKPGGKIVPIPFTTRGTIACRLDRHPGKRTFRAWVDGTIDEAGKLRRSGPKGGAPADVVTCAMSALVNNRLDVKPGAYRVTAKVSFKKIKYRVQ